MIPNAKSASHERPTAADAPGAVLRTHPQRARPPVSPRAEQEAERAPTLPETDVLQRSELVNGRDDERGAGDPSACAVPREDVARRSRRRPLERERDDARRRPT